MHSALRKAVITILLFAAASPVRADDKIYDIGALASLTGKN